MKDLYIIGNGFDLHHDIESGFKSYGEWLRDEHSNLYSQLVSFYDIEDDDEWNGFENLLGELDVENQVEEIMEDRRPDWKNLPDNDREYDNVKRDYEAAPDDAHYTFSDLYESIRQTFEEWVGQLNAPNPDEKILINQQSVFITFNYTDTLESLYHVDHSNVIYLHGCAKRGDELVLGHGKSKEEIEAECLPELPDGVNTPDEIEKFYADARDYVEDQTYESVIELLAAQRKPVEELISKINVLVPQLAELERIHIYGFSFSDIDMPYIEYLIKSVKTNNVSWEVSYHREAEATIFRDKLVQAGVPMQQITMTTLKTLTIKKSNLLFI